MLSLLSCTADIERDVGRATADAPSFSGLEALRLFIRDSLPEPFSGQVIVSHRDDVLMSGSFGVVDRASDEPVTANTVFDIGSLTKQVTATAVLRLAEEGRLNVLDTLGRYVEGLPAGKSGIVLHDLLTHQAGLPRYSGDDYETTSWDDLVRWLRQVPIDSTEVGRFSYSNPGYSILAGVVASATGGEYEAYLDRELVGVVDAAVGYRLPDFEGSVAVGYVDGQRFGRPTERAWAPDGPWWNLRGNGGMLASAEDLRRWHRGLVEGRVLSPETFERLVQPYVSVGRERDRWYGYGWYVRHTPLGTVVDHTGGNGAFFAMVRWWRDLDVLLVVTNSDFSRANAAALLASVARWVEANRDVIDAD